jgi:hypothetical protein
MFILCRRYLQSESRFVNRDTVPLLDDMERFVEERLAARARRPVDQRVPGERHPHRVAPLNGPVQQTDELRARRIRRRLARGERLCPRVADHHRRADRHAPEAPTVALAERLGFLEVLLCALLIDLGHRRRRVAYNHVRQDCRAKRWYPHRPLPGGPRDARF